jgi:ferritin
MVTKKIEQALNKQIELEAASSQFYLAMASWAENNGLSGVAAFFYQHSDEERMHMLKLIKYLNERGGKAVIPALKQPPSNFKSLQNIFDELLKHEVLVSNEINKLVDICLKEKDYTTHNFLQWYVSEQIEEEALARTILDKLNLIGNDKGGLYLFDRDLQNISVKSAAADDGEGKNK